MSEQNQVIYSKQKGRAPNKEEEFFLEAAYKNVAESVKSIEETAKFLVGATATTSGLFLAASKLSFGEQVGPLTDWLIPFSSWALAIVFQILVLFPLEYRAENQVPLAMRRVFKRAQRIKYTFLGIGAIFFIFGIFTSILIMAG